jgi:hypothetical protein
MYRRRWGLACSVCLREYNQTPERRAVLKAYESARAGDPDRLAQRRAAYARRKIARKRLEALKYTAISRSLFEATSGEQMALGGEK